MIDWLRTPYRADVLMCRIGYEHIAIQLFKFVGDPPTARGRERAACYVMTRDCLTAERLKELLSYDQETGSRWRAQMRVAGTVASLGCFDNPEDAAGTYRSAARCVHGEFAAV